ncbi:hypothetical protein llap_14010 [Limosa lapponica baueri]|uniref:Uncharacterized protein n=1 Tax=Limosa lapponica baueri TaxID=1758121 RepID=A0A2I0TPE8_LIMLA|nr:hypothetical protein llap_14010 [Limosa lapponica baueri]
MPTYFSYCRLYCCTTPQHAPVLQDWEEFGASLVRILPQQPQQQQIPYSKRSNAGQDCKESQTLTNQQQIATLAGNPYAEMKIVISN